MKTCPSCNTTLELNIDNGFFLCPSCEKQLNVRSGSITLHKNSKNINNFSKFRLGTNGYFGGSKFVVIGEVRFSDLFFTWSEWCIRFENNTYAWLTDVSGIFFIKFDISGDNIDFISSKLDPIFVDTLINLTTNNPKLFASRVIVEDVPFIYSFTLSSSISFVKGVIPISPQYNSNELVFLKSPNGAVSIVQNSLTSTYQISFNITQYELNLFNFRTLSEMSYGFQSNKFKLTSVPCPSCGGYNPNIVGVSTICYCIYCCSELSLLQKEPKVVSISPKTNSTPSSVSIPIDVIPCGTVGTIGGIKYIVVGSIVWSNENTYCIDYFLHTVSSTFLTILRYIDNKWFLIHSDFFDDLSDLVTFKSIKQAPILLTPSKLSGSFPLNFTYDTILNTTFDAEFFYDSLLIPTNETRSDFIFKHHYISLTCEMLEESKFKFKLL